MKRRGLLSGAAASLLFAALPRDPAKAFAFIFAGGTAAQRQANGIFSVKDAPYGAVGDTIMLSDGVMSSSSNPTHFSSASGTFVSGDVGKVICVGGAGASGRPLVTTISSITSGTAVVTAASCLTTVTAAITHYGTDDTVAIQAAIAACASWSTFNRSGGVVFSPAGIYMVNGNFQNTSTQNGQLYLPHIARPSPQQSITFVGVTRPGLLPPAPVVLSDDPPSSSGSIWFTPRNGSGSNPALLSAWTVNGSSDFSLWNVTVAGMCFRSAYQQPNPLIMLQFSSTNTSHIAEVACDVDATTNMISATQPVVGGIGIFTPQTNNGAYNLMRDSLTIGYDTGVVWGEHADFDNVDSYFCFTAHQVNSAYHAMYGGRVGAWSCKRGIYCNGVATAGGGANKAPLRISEFVTEHDTLSWYTPCVDVTDSGNYLSGLMTYNVVVSGTGYSNASFNKVGGTNFTCTVLF